MESPQRLIEGLYEACRSNMTFSVTIGVIGSVASLFALYQVIRDAHDRKRARRDVVVFVFFTIVALIAFTFEGRKSPPEPSRPELFFRVIPFLQKHLDVFNESDQIALVVTLGMRNIGSMPAYDFTPLLLKMEQNGRELSDVTSISPIEATSIDVGMPLLLELVAKIPTSDPQRTKDEILSNGPVKITAGWKFRINESAEELVVTLIAEVTTHGSVIKSAEIQASGP